MKKTFTLGVLCPFTSGGLRRSLTALAVVLLVLSRAAQAQVALDAGAPAYTTTAAGLTITVNNGFAEDITLNHANCTVNFNGATYIGYRTVRVNATGCAINVNMSGPTSSTFEGGINVAGTGCTITNKAGCTMSSYGAVSLNAAGAVVNNYGTISKGDFTATAAVTLNNYAGATWSGSLGSGVPAGSTVTNAGTWGGGQFARLNGVTVTNTGTWSAVVYEVQTNPVTIINSGTWTTGLGNISTGLTLTNNAPGTWTQPVTATDANAGNFALTNNATWTGDIKFPTGTNSFSNRSGATATLALFVVRGTTSISNGSNGGTPTLTLSGSTTLPVATSFINYAGTVSTTAALSNAGSLDNRATWNASSLSNSASVTNSSSLNLTGGYVNSAGTTTNTATGSLSAATYTHSGGATINNHTLATTSTAGSPLTISGGTLTNNAGASLSTAAVAASGGTLTNYHSLAVGGAFVSTGGGVSNAAGATISAASFSSSGSLVNNGTVSLSGSFTNSGGTVSNNAGATIATTTYTNAGTTTNSGTLNPTGDFVNMAGITNVVTVNSAINPGGSYTNQGLTHNYGTIQPGTFLLNENSGATITNYAGATVTTGTYLLNRAIMVNSSAITVGSSFGSEGSGSFTNSSNGVLVVATSFTNNSPFTNNGRIYQTSAGSLFRHLNGAGFTNAGYIEIAGNFTNEGNINGAASGPSGAFRVAGVSTNTGWWFGGSGAIDFCDTTPGAAPAGFNSNSAGIGGAVTVCTVLPRPLPVELTRFAATAATGRVLLSWATASERNSSHFLVERRADGRGFMAIARVEGQGSTAAATSYKFTDDQPLQGLSYYRLRQVDADGTASFSPVAAVQLSPGHASELALYPNPVADQTQLDLRSWAGGAATVQVQAVSGKTALTLPARAGEKQALDLRALPSGAYLLTVRAAGQQRTQRLLKL